MSLLPSDHPGTLLSLQRLQKSRVKPLALAELPQQCARLADKRIWAIRAPSVMLGLHGWPCE
jgi:hypothetical protein